MRPRDAFQACESTAQRNVCLQTTGAMGLQAWESLYGVLQRVCAVVPWGSMWMQGMGACKPAAGRATAGSAHCTATAREELQWWKANVATTGASVPRGRCLTGRFRCAQTPLDSEGVSTADYSLLPSLKHSKTNQ